MSKTIVIVLSETRASESTFDSFKKNVIDELNADLCVCIGVKPDYDYNNPFYNLAKYKFTYNEQDDFGDALEYAYTTISQNKPNYECLHNVNALNGKIQNPQQSTNNITFYGNNDDNLTNFNNFTDDEVVIHTKDFPDELWKNQVYGIKNSNNDNLVSEENVITYKKPLHWREFLKVKDQFLGGVNDSHNQHPGSAGILIFFRWFLLKNLIDNDLINKYDRFIITRSDFIYQLPHPKVEHMNDNCIWIPDCEHYCGYTDRHVVLSKNNIEFYLNILNNLVLRSNEYFMKMKHKIDWNFEQLIKFHLEQNNVLHLVKEFPYVMYSVRNINGTTRWSQGHYSNKFGYYIKYQSEYNKSSYYKNEFEKSGLTIDEFYKKISIRKKYNINTPIQLNTIDKIIIDEYENDLKFINTHFFINGVNSNSYNQIPDVCKKYMNYINNNWQLIWCNNMIDELLNCCDNSEYKKLSPNDYPNSSLQFVEVFNKFVNLSGKTCLVLGSISPWIECLLLHFNAKCVTTLDYIKPECNYKINTLSMNNYNKYMKYDVVISFSSLEHDGLGRYGDPINPNGDIDACIEAYSMLNKEGYFICGIPIGYGCIEGNFHRIYNKKRINKLFSLFHNYIGSVNYQTLDNKLNFTGQNWQNQPIFIYKK